MKHFVENWTMVQNRMSPNLRFFYTENVEQKFYEYQSHFRSDFLCFKDDFQWDMKHCNGNPEISEISIFEQFWKISWSLSSEKLKNRQNSMKCLLKKCEKLSFLCLSHTYDDFFSTKRNLFDLLNLQKSAQNHELFLFFVRITFWVDLKSCFFSTKRK